MEPLRIKGIVGKLIRDPKTGKRISVDRTMVVPRTAYWLRRLKAGDVEKVGSEPKKQPEKKSKPKASPEVSNKVKTEG